MYRCIKWKKNDRHIVQPCKTIQILLYKGSPGDRSAKWFGIGARTKWPLLLVQLLSFQCRWCSKHSSYEHFVPTNAASCEHFVPTNAASYEHFVPTNASTLQAFHLFFHTTKMILSFCSNETKQNVNIILSHTVPPPAELTAHTLTYVKTSDRIAQKWITVKWCITYTTTNLIWNVHILKVDYSSWKCWHDSSFAKYISTHLPMRALNTQEVFVVQSSLFHYCCSYCPYCHYLYHYCITVSLPSTHKTAAVTTVNCDWCVWRNDLQETAPDH